MRFIILCIILFLLTPLTAVAKPAYKPQPYLKATVTEVELVNIEKVKDVPTLIKEYAALYNVDPGIPLRIARCESGYRPDAKNKSSTATGVYQWLKGSWSYNRTKLGLDPNPDLRLNAEENIKTSLLVMSKNGYGDWKASQSCWKSQ